MDFKSVEEYIKPLLKKYEETKSDDMVLYLKYVELKGGNFTQTVLDREYRITHGIAAYETVSRARRRLQAKYKYLRPSKKYIEDRKKAEHEYKEYAKAKGGK